MNVGRHSPAPVPSTGTEGLIVLIFPSEVPGAKTVSTIFLTARKEVDMTALFLPALWALPQPYTIVDVPKNVQDIKTSLESLDIKDQTI